jgi:hypothetical protein
MPNTITLANLSDVQPYYAAFLAMTGGGEAVEYIIWINQAWNRFMARIGAKSDMRKFHAAEFGEWLAAASALSGVPEGIAA